MPLIPTTLQFGGQIWGRSDGQPAPSATACDVQASLLDCLYRLGFQPAGELNGTSWVTPSELLQFADDEAKKLAYENGVFIQWDASIAVVAGTASYSEPPTHVFTVLAALFPAGGGLQLLRLTPVRDLWALDGNWVTTSGNAVRCSLDAASVGTITLYPNPIAGGTLGQVCQEYQTVAPGSTTIALPPVLQDLFSYAMLAGARGKESDNADQGMAGHYRQRVSLYEQVCDHLWAPGQ